MLNTIIGITGTLVIVGLFCCLWKWLKYKIKKDHKKIEIIKYKKYCQIILYVSIGCFLLFLAVIVLWFLLVYPTLK